LSRFIAPTGEQSAAQPNQPEEGILRQGIQPILPLRFLPLGQDHLPNLPPALQGKVRKGCNQQFLQFRPDALDTDTIKQRRFLSNRLLSLFFHSKAQHRLKAQCPQNTQRILFKAQQSRTHRPNDSVVQVLLPAKAVEQTPLDGKPLR
jgi:hypothetical protein